MLYLMGKWWITEKYSHCRSCG